MKTLLINQQEVHDLLPMSECMDVMEKVLAGLARGECRLPLRQILWLPEKTGALGLMPSYWKPAGMIGLKAVTFFPGNEGTDLDTHQGAVLLYDDRDGRLLAMIDATSITAIRTAAVSGVATKLLAREESSELAILGSGVQAQNHLQAMLLCRSITHVKVAGKTFHRAKKFAAKACARYSIQVVAAASCREAIADADIICTTTSAREPVLLGDWLNPGVHLNAVGSSVASARELDGGAVQKSRLFVDRRESAINEAGDFVLAKEEGLLNDDHIVAELGELLIDAEAGRRAASEITLFKSVGLAVEDLAAGAHVYRKALDRGVGTAVELGGRRIAID